VLPIMSQALTTLAFRLIAIQTTAITLITLATLTPTIPDSIGTCFSRVRSVSKWRKLKSSKSSPKQLSW
jgi:hypothetical protein